MKISLLPFALIFCCPVAMLAQASDTLRGSMRGGGYAYYNDRSITMQAARFDLPAPGTITAVSVVLGGGTGRVRMHFYGNEGGVMAPLLEKDLTAPLMIDKTRAGIQRYTLTLARPLECGSNQIFVAADSITGGVHLLTDRHARTPSCQAKGDAFSSQVLKVGEGSWRWGKYGFAIDVMIQYARSQPRGFFAEATADAGLVDSLRYNASIAVSDVDRDGALDLLADGRLYHNDGSGRFTDVTDRSGISGAPKANAFIDADNDGALDVVFIGDAGDHTGGATCRLFLNDGHGSFTQHDLTTPPIVNPSSFSIADVDGDGYPDIFIGQLRSSESRGNVLLVNDHHGGFTDSSSLLGVEGRRLGYCNGAQWVDYNNDGRPDLYLVADDPAQDELLQNRGDGTLINVAPEIFPAEQRISGARSRGCAWADYDNDGDMDLLRPIGIPVRSAKAVVSAFVLTNVGTPRFDASPDEVPVGAIEYREARAGGTWGDVDNDGLLDFFLASSGPCRFAELYLQREPGTFTAATFDYGLFRAAAGKDGVLADMDNDGRLDLVTIVDGRLRLFRNTSPRNANYIELDLRGLHAVDARATVFAGGHSFTREASSGRGVLMQEPLRLHIGLGGAAHVDSVIVRWGNGREEVVRDVPANSIASLLEGASPVSQGAAAHVISASPNPFTDRITIRYEVRSRTHVTLALHKLEGDRVAVLVDEVVDAGVHEASWDGKDRDGMRAAQGVYVYRLSSSGGDAMGKVVLVR